MSNAFDLHMIKANDLYETSLMAIDDGGPLKILIEINNMIMIMAPGMMLT